MRPGEKPSKSSKKLADMIHKAIADCEITGSEYDAIMKVANEDQHIDRQEQNLLNQLQSLMANGTIKRVKG
ncbi:MAG: histone H1/H5 family protein [Deltaproteobacteria bacterium]|nr:histone H1/H5 family protein [Deltaproteobacteria bacterium]